LHGLATEPTGYCGRAPDPLLQLQVQGGHPKQPQLKLPNELNPLKQLNGQEFSIKVSDATSTMELVAGAEPVFTISKHNLYKFDATPELGGRNNLYLSNPVKGSLTAKS